MSWSDRDHHLLPLQPLYEGERPDALVERQVTQAGLPDLSSSPSGWLRHTDEFGLPHGNTVFVDLVVLLEYRIRIEQNERRIETRRTRLESLRLLCSLLVERLDAQALFGLLALVLRERPVPDDDAVFLLSDERSVLMGAAEHGVDLVLRTAAILLLRERSCCAVEILRFDGPAIAVEEFLDALPCISCHGDTFPTLCIFLLTKPVNRNVRETIPLTTLSDEIYAS